MLRGPKGEKRPGDVIGAAVIAKIATGEIEEGTEPETKAATALGKRGGKATAASLTPEQRSEVARTAAAARWKDRTVRPPRDCRPNTVVPIRHLQSSEPTEWVVSSD